MLERLSDKNPCDSCKVDRQIGNPNRWECECDRCLKHSEWKDECIKRLEEYEIAEENGMIVILPCKVGDIVYIIFDQKIYKGKCDGFEYDRLMSNWFINIKTPDLGKTFEIFEDIGKTIFFTKEEAEKALGEMK